MSMDEDEQERFELEQTNKMIKKLTDFLVDAEKDYVLETWDSGEGRDVILIGSDEDFEQEYKVKFSFRNNGYISIDVEKIDAKVKDEVSKHE